MDLSWKFRCCGFFFAMALHQPFAWALVSISFQLIAFLLALGAFGWIGYHVGRTVVFKTYYIHRMSRVVIQWAALCDAHRLSPLVPGFAVRRCTSPSQWNWWRLVSWRVPFCFALLLVFCGFCYLLSTIHRREPFGNGRHRKSRQISWTCPDKVCQFIHLVVRRWRCFGFACCWLRFHWYYAWAQWPVFNGPCHTVNQKNMFLLLPSVASLVKKYISRMSNYIRHFIFAGNSGLFCCWLRFHWFYEKEKENIYIYIYMQYIIRYVIDHISYHIS